MKKPNRYSAGERQLRYLLHDLCTELGYCLPDADADRMATYTEITAEDFALEVLQAEGLGLDQASVKKIVEFFV